MVLRDLGLKTVFAICRFVQVRTRVAFWCEKSHIVAKQPPMVDTLDPLVLSR